MQPDSTANASNPPTPSTDLKAQTTTQQPTQVPPLRSGFSFTNLALATLLIRSMRVGGTLASKTITLEQPLLARARLNEGFNTLAHTLGYAFKLLCNQWNYDPAATYDACIAYITQEDKWLSTGEANIPGLQVLAKDQISQFLQKRKQNDHK